MKQSVADTWATAAAGAILMMLLVALAIVLYEATRWWSRSSQRPGPMLPNIGARTHARARVL